VRRHSLAGLFFCLLAGCGGGPAAARANPARLRLVNRTGAVVQGVVVRFDREVVRVDFVVGTAFPEVRLRLDPPDTVRLAGGRMVPDGATVWRVAGKVGAPAVVEARWIVDGRLGPRLGDAELELR